MSEGKHVSERGSVQFREGKVKQLSASIEPPAEHVNSASRRTIPVIVVVPSNVEFDSTVKLSTLIVGGIHSGSIGTSHTPPEIVGDLVIAIIPIVNPAIAASVLRAATRKIHASDRSLNSLL